MLWWEKILENEVQNNIRKNYKWNLYKYSKKNEFEVVKDGFIIMTYPWKWMVCEDSPGHLYVTFFLRNSICHLVRFLGNCSFDSFRFSAIWFSLQNSRSFKIFRLLFVIESTNKTKTKNKNKKTKKQKNKKTKTKKQKQKQKSKNKKNKNQKTKTKKQKQKNKNKKQKQENKKTTTKKQNQSRRLKCR